VASVAIPQPKQRAKDVVAQQRVRWTSLIFAATIGSEILLGLRPQNPLDISNPWVASGSGVLLLGLLIRTWAAGTLVKKKRLISDGPYALVRHPLYLGSILLMLGFTLLTGMWWNLALACVVAIISFGGAIRGEERFLADKFGEKWTSYSSRCGRLLPRRIAGSLATSWHRKRWLKNREFNAWLGAIVGWLGLLVWYQLRH
jgi:protein-S-isoprenylcysteine O-methyltransferase Ste14